MWLCESVLVIDRSKLPPIDKCGKHAFYLVSELAKSSRSATFPPLKIDNRADNGNDKISVIKNMKSWAGENDEDLAGQKFARAFRFDHLIVWWTRMRVAESCLREGFTMINMGIVLNPGTSERLHPFGETSS